MPSLSDIEWAIEYVSSQPYGTNEAYVSLDTGEVYLLSDELDCDLPDDFEESDRYIQIPHKNDLDLGRRLVDEFVASRAPHLADDAADAFRRRGAYSKWKSILAKPGLLEPWYEFENQRESAAIAQWCAEHHLPIESGKSAEEKG